MKAQQRCEIILLYLHTKNSNIINGASMSIIFRTEKLFMLYACCVDAMTNKDILFYSILAPERVFVTPVLMMTQRGEL